jgi:HlyD family secretion protein
MAHRLLLGELFEETAMIQDTHSMDEIVAKGPGLSRQVKILLGATALTLLSLVLLWPSLRRWSSAEESIDLSRLRLATVARGDLERDVAAEGRVVAANHPRLYSPAQGIVTLQVKAGESVRRGQVLARIASPELESQLAQEISRLDSLESELSRSKIGARQTNTTNERTLELRRVQLEAARRELQRTEKLMAEGLVNQVELDRDRDAVRLAEVELRQAEEGGSLQREALDFETGDRARQMERQRLVVGELERRVRELTIAAPFDGLVANVEVQDRDAVQPNAPLLTVVDLSEYEIEVRIPDSYADDVAPGLPAVIELGGKAWPGELTAVSPEVTNSQVQGTVHFTGEIPDGLRQSQRVSVRLVLERRPDVLKVPRGPFLDSGGGRQIYVLADGLATLRQIRTGATSVGEVEILEGLEAGERIILSDLTLFNGAKTVLVRQ